MRRRPTSGQATAEYAALLALVAVALAGAAAITGGGLGGAVAATVERALCSVAGGACRVDDLRRAGDLAPCPVWRRQVGQSVTVGGPVVDATRRVGVTEERRSDGRVTVGFLDGEGAGVHGELGLRVRLGSVRARLGIFAAAQVSFTSGREWTLPGRAAAEDFVRRYGGGHDLGGWALGTATLGLVSAPDPPPADATYTRGGLDARAEADTAGLGPGVRLALGVAAGTRRGRDGSRTVYLALDGSSSAALVAALDGATAAGTAVVAALDLDPRGHPVRARLDVVRSGPGAPAGHRVTEEEVAVDLADPADARALGALLAPPLPGAGHGDGRAGALRRLERDATITRRVYAVRTSEGGAALGVLGMGVDLAGARSAMTLTGAWTRLPGMRFLPRADCLTAAAAGAEPARATSAPRA